MNLAGLGSDGSSVMFRRVGNRTDVKLQKEGPMLVHVNCVAHRLLLVCADAAKEFPYLLSLKDTLKNLYIHVTGSGVRTCEPDLKPKDPINICWLALENSEAN